MTHVLPTYFDRAEELKAQLAERGSLGLVVLDASALEGIVRRFPFVDEFQIEVFRRGALDEVRLLLEIPDGAGPAGSVRDTLAGIAGAIRRDLGIRIEVFAVPARTLPRYELKARRVVRREAPADDAVPPTPVIHPEHLGP